MFAIPYFQGELPRYHPRHITDTVGQVVNNVDLDTGELVPYPKTLRYVEPTKVGVIEAIYRFNPQSASDAKGQITSATQANPVVIGSANHGRATGDTILISGIIGMSELNDRQFTVTVIGDNTFSLDGEDGTGHAAYVSGGAWVKINGAMFHWVDTETDDPFLVEVARAIVGQDASALVIFTGIGDPKITFSPDAESGGTDYPILDYRLGTPAPLTAPTAAKSGTGDGNPISQSYVYTFVGTYGTHKLEGPPSPASVVIDLEGGETANLTALETVAPPGWASTLLTHKRIYRSVTGTTGTIFYFIAEILLATATYDDASGDPFQEALLTTTWDPPPQDMHSVITLPNGIMAGISKNELLLSVPFQPHAWPTDFRIAMESDGVSIGAFGNQIIVATESRPYRAVGTTDPNSTTLRRINLEQGCVSRRSLVSMGDLGVFYASADGLVHVTTTEANIIEPWMDRDEWLKLNPSSIHGYYWDQKYVGFYDTGLVQAGFIFYPQDREAGLTFLDVHATAGFYDPISDLLFLVFGDWVEIWGANFDPLTFTWKSKLHHEARPVNNRFCQVIADTYVDLAANIYGDGVLLSAHAVASGEPFPCGDGAVHRQWEIELIGTDHVQNAAIGESVADVLRAQGVAG